MNHFTPTPSDCEVTYECISIKGVDEKVKCHMPGVTTFDGILDGEDTDGTFTFLTTDREAYRHGEYTVSIRGTTGLDVPISAEATFVLTIGEPCKFVELSLAYDPFDDMTYRLGERTMQTIFSLQKIVRLDDSLVSSSSCGDFGIEFSSDAADEQDLF